MDDIVGILCETDVGLRTAEYLSSTLELSTSNGVDEARRDKYIMMETLKEKGVNYIKQILTDQWIEAEAFIKNTLGGYPVVMKPARGSGSRDVYKCNNASHALPIFTSLLGKPGYANGTKTDAILVQEYIEGTEYVVDISTSNQDHKVVGMWRHDKRDVGDVAFIYYCSELLSDTTTDTCNKLHDYGVQIVDALGVKYGPSHLEIKINDKTKEPVLIEANIGRLHGLDIVGLSNLAYGYNLAETTVHAYLDKYTNNQGNDIANVPHKATTIAHAHHNKQSRWNSFPSRVPTARMHVRLAHLVNSQNTQKLLREKQEIRNKIEGLDSVLGK